MDSNSDSDRNAERRFYENDGVCTPHLSMQTPTIFEILLLFCKKQKQNKNSSYNIIRGVLNFACVVV